MCDFSIGKVMKLAINEMVIYRNLILVGINLVVEFSQLLIYICHNLSDMVKKTMGIFLLILKNTNHLFYHVCFTHKAFFHLSHYFGLANMNKDLYW